MAGIDQTKGLNLLNNLLKDLGIYKKGEVEGDIQDFASIFAQAEDTNEDGQIDVQEFTQALAKYTEYNFDPNSLTTDQLNEIGDEYADLFEQIFGVDGASATEISDLSKIAGDDIASGGYTSKDTTMDDVKSRFSPTIEQANTENMSLADMRSNLATSEQALAAKHDEIAKAQETNEAAYVEALEKAAESNEALAGLKDQRAEKEGLVAEQDTIISDLSEQIDFQVAIIEAQDNIISDCDLMINQGIPSPKKDDKGNIINQSEIDKAKSDIAAAKAKKDEAEATKANAEQNKLDLEAKKVEAEEQKLVLEAEILDIDKQVENEIKNNDELAGLAEKLEAYKEANTQLMSLEADRVQLEKNINIYEKAIAEAEAEQEPVTEQETTGLLEDADVLKDENGVYQYDVKPEDTLETVVETNYDIAALVEATGLERSEVISKLTEELNGANGIGETGVIYDNQMLAMVDAYAVLGVEDKRPEATDGVDPNAKRDLDDTQVDSVVDYLLGDLDIDGIDIDPKEAWNNHDFSQYTPETLAKIAAAYEEKVGAADVSFLEMAELNIEAEDKLSEIAGGLISAANSSDINPDVKAQAQAMLNEHIDKALESGDPTFIQAIINSPDEYLNDVKAFIEESGLVDKLYESEHTELSDLRDELIAKQNDVYVSEEMQAQLDKLLSDDPEIAAEAWQALDLSNPDAIADLQIAYDEQIADGDATFLQKAAEMYGKTFMDDVLAEMDNLPIEGNELPVEEWYVTVGGEKQLVGDIVTTLQEDKDFSILSELPASEVAKIAYAYGNIAQFEFFMQQQGISEGSTEFTDIRRAVDARNDEVVERGEQREAKEAEFEEKEAEQAYNDAIDDAYATLEEKIDEFNASNARLAALGVDPNDPSEIYDAINATVTDPNLTPEQRLDVLQRLSANDATKSYVQGFLTDSQYEAESFVTSMFNSTSAPEEAVEFLSWYSQITDPSKQNSEDLVDIMIDDANIEKLISVYQNATPEEIATLNSTLDIGKILYKLPQLQVETILYAMATSKKHVVPTVQIGDEVYELTEEEQDALIDKYIQKDSYGLFGIQTNDGSNKTFDGIIEAYKNGTLNKDTALWLLKESDYQFKEFYFHDTNGDADKQILFSLFT